MALGMPPAIAVSEYDARGCWSFCCCSAAISFYKEAYLTYICGSSRCLDFRALKYQESIRGKIQTLKVTQHKTPPAKAGHITGHGSWYMLYRNSG